MRGPLTKRIAAAIRLTDGSHTMGAAELAEKIVELVPELEVANQVATQRIANHRHWGPRSIELRHWTYRGWLPTMVEEVGEVAREMQGEDTSRLRAECIDVMGVAWMLIDSIDEDPGPQ